MVSIALIFLLPSKALHGCRFRSGFLCTKGQVRCVKFQIQGFRVSRKVLEILDGT